MPGRWAHRWKPSTPGGIRVIIKYEEICESFQITDRLKGLGHERNIAECQTVGSLDLD